MSIFKNGKKITKIFKNGKEITSIFHDNAKIYGNDGCISVYTEADILAIPDNSTEEYCLKNDISISSAPSFLLNNFAGVFHGNGFTLNLKGGFISNLEGNVENLNIVVTNNDLAKKSVFGTNNGILENIKLSGNTTCALVANNSKTINNCASSATVANESSVAGIAKVNVGETSIISNCFFSGKLSTASADYGLGGICGTNNGTIENCYNVGEILVSNVDGCGGICGYNKNNGIIKNCYNNTSITNNDLYTGGIVGSNDSTIENCYNVGNISGEFATGGIVGINNGSFKNCYNLGDISGETGTGGIAGYNYATFKNCYNLGDISGDLKIGGIVGSNNSTIENCYNVGNISGITATGFGSVVGFDVSDGIINSYTKNDVLINGVKVKVTSGSANVVGNDPNYTLNCDVNDLRNATWYTDTLLWNSSGVTADTGVDYTAPFEKIYYPYLLNTKKDGTYIPNQNNLDIV